MPEAWIVANRAGLANTLSELERTKLIEEIVQNAMDTEAKNIVVLLKEPKYGYATLTVEDDDPEGFIDMSMAYEMFADTPKRKDRTKRGRFTIGEKRVLAMSRRASIESTKGSVLFEIVNGKEDRTNSRKKRDVGTLATFEIKMTEEQYAEIRQGIRSIIPDESVKILFNGESVPHRKPVLTFTAKLKTEAADEEGQMKRFQEETEVRLYEPMNHEKAMLYELGIPVVATGDRWHVDVRQRVPLNSERDNVPAEFLENVRAFVVNHAHEMLTEDEASEKWVREAAGSKLIEKEAYEAVETKIHGEKKVIADPSDPESISRAVAEGYTPIFGRTLTPEEFKNNRRFNTISSSSSLFPSPRPYSDDPNAPMVDVVPFEKWTPGMKLVHAYTVALAKELMNQKLSVRYVNTSNGFSACYGKDSGPYGPQFDYNIKRLGKRYFEDIDERTDALIIHEFGHQFSSNHLDEGYYRALCDLGARFKKLAIEKPEFFKPYLRKQ